MKEEWIKCSAVRVLNGKLQIRNPGGFWDRFFQQKSGGASKKFNKQYTKGYFDKKESREVPVKAKPLSLTATDNEVISALVSQGAKKQQAKIAVQAAKARGASGFEGIFRGALKELT
jgi:P pilus assembly chaperone PapD